MVLAIPYRIITIQQTTSITIKYYYIVILIVLQIHLVFGQTEKTNVYLIPGQGSDYRLFSNIDLGDKYKLINIDYDYLIEGGSHMMTLTRGAEISSLIRGPGREHPTNISL